MLHGAESGGRALRGPRRALDQAQLVIKALQTVLWRRWKISLPHPRMISPSSQTVTARPLINLSSDHHGVANAFESPSGLALAAAFDDLIGPRGSASA
jgi:hypothetical protein